MFKFIKYEEAMVHDEKMNRLDGWLLEGAPMLERASLELAPPFWRKIFNELKRETHLKNST